MSDLHSKYYNLNAFDSPDLPNSYINMNQKVIDVLDNLTELSGIHFMVNSGYRTLEHNMLVGGIVNSEHTKGNAIDIHVSDAATRYIVIKNLLLLNVSRIGVYNLFIHFDVSSVKPQNVIWHSLSGFQYA